MYLKERNEISVHTAEYVRVVLGCLLGRASRCVAFLEPSHRTGLMSRSVDPIASTPPGPASFAVLTESPGRFHPCLERYQQSRAVT